MSQVCLEEEQGTTASQVPSLQGGCMLWDSTCVAPQTHESLWQSTVNFDHMQLAMCAIHGLYGNCLVLVLSVH